jgi:hypothetical protein
LKEAVEQDILIGDPGLTPDPGPCRSSPISPITLPGINIVVIWRGYAVPKHYKKTNFGKIIKQLNIKYDRWGSKTGQAFSPDRPKVL